MTLLQSILLYSLLLLFPKPLQFFSIGQSIFRVAKSQNSLYIVAPELFRQESFALARIEKIGKSPYKLNVDVSIVNQTSLKKCSINLMPEAKATNVGVTSIRRLASNRVLIIAYDEFAHGERKIVPILLDLQDCSFIFPYSKVVPARHSIFTTNNNKDERNRFMIVIADKNVCSPHNTCVFTVLINLSYVQFEAFDIDSDLKSVNIEPLSVSYDSHLYIVHGIDDANTYKLLLYNTRESPVKRKELLSLPNANSMQIESSDLAACWIKQPGKDKSVHCAKFSDNGTLIFNRTVHYQEPITISFVQNTYLRLLLFTSKLKCEGIECWIIFISMLSSDDQSEEVTNYHTSRLECMGDRKQLVVFKARKDVGSTQAEYICDNGYDFSFNVIAVAD